LHGPEDMATRARRSRFRPRLPALGCCAIVLAFAATVGAEPVPVRYAEGVVHGFLSLSTLDGTRIAAGDLLQTARGDRVTSRLVFHFHDGSLLDETAVFTQRGRFRLVQDHLVQKGPSFPQPLDVTIDGASGSVRGRFESEGKATAIADRLRLPPDVANGMIPLLLKNVQPGLQHLTLSMVATTPKARLVTLQIANTGEEPFSVGGSERKATHYVVKVDIGGVAGVVAPLIGKQPPDSHVWILYGDVPAFVRSEGPLYNGGPIWRIELASPAWKR